MMHIYNCKILNKERPKENFDKIFENNLNKMEYILKRFEENKKQREKLMKNMRSLNVIHCSFDN